MAAAAFNNEKIERRLLKTRINVAINPLGDFPRI
jgi:hypothetical protein